MAPNAPALVAAIRQKGRRPSFQSCRNSNENWILPSQIPRSVHPEELDSPVPRFLIVSSICIQMFYEFQFPRSADISRRVESIHGISGPLCVHDSFSPLSYSFLQRNRVERGAWFKLEENRKVSRPRKPQFCAINHRVAPCCVLLFAISESFYEGQN